MRYLFKDQCWERHPRGCSLHCLWLRKLAEAIAKALESQNGNFGTFIYENNGN